MKNNIITIILVVLLGMIAFWYLTKTDNTATYLTAEIKTSDSVDAKYVYNMLQQMAEVKLDNSIFSDTVFQTLKDNTVSFPTQAAGRNNPFAPIGSDLSTGAQTVSPTKAPVI